MKKQDLDFIDVRIYISSEFCQQLRDQGLFFDAICNALNLGRESIEEIEDLDLEFHKEGLVKEHRK